MEIWVSPIGPAVDFIYELVLYYICVIKELNVNKEHLVSFLDRGVVAVTFTKKNGDVRNMRCTRNLDMIPFGDHPLNGIYASTDTLVHAYDLDEEGWRSFNPKRLINAETISEG